MWELLQKLEKLGWKPYGKSIAELTETEKNVRLLTSLSSGLWQFVCENKLYNPDNRGYWGKNVIIVGEYPTLDGDENIGYRDYEYYIIESALKDESELESFILENIKIGND